MPKERKLICEWTSQNPFVNVEAERMYFADLVSLVSAEENLRFKALEIEIQWDKYDAINDWLEEYIKNVETIGQMEEESRVLRVREMAQEQIDEEMYHNFG